MNASAPLALREEDPAGSACPKSPRPMTRLGRMGMIVILSLLCAATLRANTYLLGGIFGVSKAIGYPLVPFLAAVWWIAPLLIFPALRDVGSLRFPISWTVLLAMPFVIVNWCFSVYWLPIPLPVLWLSSGSYSMEIPAWLCSGSHAVATGVFEELVFRGYAFRRMPLSHPRFVVLTSAVCFSLSHLPWLFQGRPLAGVLHQVVFALAVGIALGIVRLISGSLGWCILIHAAIDAAGAVNSFRQGEVPGLQRWTPYAAGMAAVASLIVLCVHATFKSPHNPPESPKCHVLLKLRQNFNLSSLADGKSGVQRNRLGN